MSRKSASAIVSGMGVGMELVMRIHEKCRKWGLSDEVIRQLVTSDGDVLLEHMVQALAFKFGEPGQLFVDYTSSLSDMIKEFWTGYVSQEITEENLPINGRPNSLVEMRIFSPEELSVKVEWRTVSRVDAQEVTRALEAIHWKNAELPEGLVYAKANPNRDHHIAMLGSTCRHQSYLSFPSFCGAKDKPSLILRSLHTLSGEDRILAVRRWSDPRI